MRRTIIAALGVAAALFAPGLVQAADLTVMSSGGFAAALKTLQPGFEAASGDRLATVSGPSMGDTPQSIPSRLKRGEPADVVIMARDALDALAAAGLVDAGSEVDLARSKIAVVVKAGAPTPDISTVDGLRRLLLNARSVAYSDSASGVYVSQQLFAKLGVADQMAAKSRMIPAIPVGGVVARGEAEVGFQQLSELKPIEGVTIIGLLPDAVQKVTVFSAGVVSSSRQPSQGRALIRYLSSPAADAKITDSGMEPAR